MANYKRALEAYMDKIGEGKLLTDEQERQLAERIQQGDRKALNTLVERNLKFVVSMAGQYKGQGVPIDDLVSEGNIGMVKAAERFSPQFGKRFVTFAAPIIRDAMEAFIRKNGEAIRSVDAPIPAGSNNNFNLLNILENTDAPMADSQLTKDSDIQQMSRFITILAPREQRVVSLIYGIEGERHTMAEVASLMGLKRERVRQVRDQALRKLGEAAKANA